MGTSELWAQAAEEELQIMQRRLAEPIAQRKSLEDHMASMYQLSVKKQQINRRVVSRVLIDDECDWHDLKEAFANWKVNMECLHAWRLKVEWENRVKAREEEQERVLKEKENALREKALFRIWSGQTDALLHEIIDVWRAAAATNR